ncbi:unnamed protein product [Ixodes hexagonus]
MASPALFIVTTLLDLQRSSGSWLYPERNPALQEYQDEFRNFPIKGTWYMRTRNYKSNPVLGETAKCVRFTQTGVGANGENLLLLEYGDTSVTLNSTLRSSPGYSAKNIGRYSHGPCLFSDKSTTEMVTAYVDPKECDILRMTYISETACALLVPEKHVNDPPACCLFIFDLLCGTEPKYQIYDKSCSQEN